MRRSTRIRLIRFAIYALVLGLFAAVALTAGRNFSYQWQWGRFFGDYSGLLVKGLGYTLAVAALSLCFALPIGVLVGLCRTSHDPGARLFGSLYVELIRGTPLLVQVMIWYFVIAKALESLVTLDSFKAGVCALSCFTAAYIAEIVRAGIQGVDPGQMEAARSLGLSHSQAMIHVVLPQAFRRILPPLASEFIALVKDSSLASVIGLEELTKRAQDIQGRSYLTFEPWLTVALLYLVICVLLSLGVRWLERWLGVGHREQAIR